MKITDLQSKIDHCYTLAENGATEMAKVGLQKHVKEFSERLNNYTKQDAYSFMYSIDRVTHRIGVNTSLRIAEVFYKKGEKKEARNYLLFAKMHAKHIQLDISDNISEMKGKYKDRLSLLQDKIYSLII